MSPLQFTQKISRAEAAQWADSHGCSDVIAAAIHAISSPCRDAHDIWEDPSPAEWDQVICAVGNFVGAGVYQASDDGRYHWGCEVIKLPESLGNA